MSLRGDQPRLLMGQERREFDPKISNMPRCLQSM